MRKQKRIKFNMKNLANRIGIITQDDSFKAIKKANRELDLEAGRKPFSKVHKDKKKEGNKKECRNFKN